MQHAPVLAIDHLAVLGGGGLREAPLRRQGVQAFLGQRADRDDADAVLAGQRHARRADLRGDRERHVLLQRQQLQRGVLQREPVGRDGQALAAHQAADDADGLVLAVAQQHRVDAEGVGVRRQRARPGAEDHAPAGHVVELHHPLRHVVGMVIGQGDDAGGELDALRALARRGEEHLGRADHLPAAGVVLAAPELVVARARPGAATRSRSRRNCSIGCSPIGMVGGEEGAEVSRGMSGSPGRGYEGHGPLLPNVTTAGVAGGRPLGGRRGATPPWRRAGTSRYLRVTGVGATRQGAITGAPWVQISSHHDWRTPDAAGRRASASPLTSTLSPGAGRLRSARSSAAITTRSSASSACRRRWSSSSTPPASTAW